MPMYGAILVRIFLYIEVLLQYATPRVSAETLSLLGETLQTGRRQGGTVSP